MWEQRYATAEFVFGKSPALFLQDHDAYLTPDQSALSIADGEGRNSVFMATKGMAVRALENAPSALAKARILAKEHDVTVDIVETDVFDYDWGAQGFDLTVGIFIQFVGPKKRETLFQGMKEATNPGGLIMLHGYTPQQLEFGTGGPKAVENLYTEENLRASFDGWTVLECRAYIRDIDEGCGHSGQSALIDFIARKPISAS